MPKGKKKDKKKEDLPIENLSLADNNQPSSSQVRISEDEGGLGLTGGGRKKQKTQKEQLVGMDRSVSEAGVDTKEQQQCETTKSLEEELKKMEVDIQKRKDEDCEMLGLGLGGPKKRGRKKKKPDSALPSVSNVGAEAAPQAAPQTAPQTAPQIAPQTAPHGIPKTHKQTFRPAQELNTPDLPSSPWSQPNPKILESPSAPQSHESTSGHVPVVQVPSKTETSRAPSTRCDKKSGRGQSTTTTVTCQYKIPHKILGTLVPCRTMKLLANYLEMTIKPLKLYRYDVSFTPNKPKKFLRAAYAAAVELLFKDILLAFDQCKNVYAICELPGALEESGRIDCLVMIPDGQGKTLTYDVSFKFTGIVDLSTIISYMKDGSTSLYPPTEAIQAIDVIIHQGTLESYVKVGRQFFRRPLKPVDLGDGLEMWTGLFQSAIFTSRPFVNIDVAHKGFPRSQMLIDAYRRDFGLDTSKAITEQRGRSVDAFHQFVRGLKVTAFLGGDVQNGTKREFVVNELVEPPRKMTFTYNEGKENETIITVQDYFVKEKNCRIQYQNLSCVWVGPKTKRIYYPMEFLQVAYGQVSNKQLNDTQLSKLVKVSATPPHERKEKIEEVIANMNYSKSEYFKKFGLDISNKFVDVNAKVLQPPKMELGRATVEPRRGVWQTKRLLQPQPLESWGLISVDTDPRNSFNNVINMITGIATEMGMRVQPPKMASFNVQVTELMRTLQMVKDKGIRILFVIISARGRDYYHRLKRTAEREVGVLTQCIKEGTILHKMNDQTFRNIMLKVNSKLMGINHALDARSIPRCLQNCKVMVVGADVTHPPPDQNSVPSIAAVTASIDSKFTIYNVTLSVQAPKKEVIVDFEDMMLEHLNEFYKRQRELPTKIFVFRDGVSEGQFCEVMNSELKAIHRAYSRKIGSSSTKRVEVLFLLVQKRHHTRLFVGDSPMNVEPGTVVDSYIVHPKELDFYLVSHQAIKGTARPTRYHAVANDSRIPQDEVEQLTYYLCHLYARCTRAVSYPTPTYYAHLACLRARSLTYGDRYACDELEKSPKRLRVLERILETSKMFFV